VNPASALPAGDLVRVKVNGVDVFDPSTGEVRSDGADGIACWFIDTDYNGESFFVRHAYFLGQNDPYSALKTTLKAEVNQEVWDTLHSDTSRPFAKPKSGRIAVKMINHLGDEVKNPFSPGAGSPPPELVGRDPVLEQARVWWPAAFKTRKKAAARLLQAQRNGMAFAMTGK
jgi:hypothetical protein